MVKESKDNLDFLANIRDITMMEIGRDDVNVSLTPGKIILWFGRQVSESLIRQVIFEISSIDSRQNAVQPRFQAGGGFGFRVFVGDTGITAQEVQKRPVTEGPAEGKTTAFKPDQ
ncbi:MAG: hypothetical protein O8C56_10665, partial [Candidatus Methanoperedens sp.]|nr:hypothetical protein [Candidatus Methanoperedens sp.]